MGCSSSQFNHRRVYKKQKEEDYSTSGDEERGAPDGQESFQGIDMQKKLKPKPKKPKSKNEIVRSVSSEIQSGTDITLLKGAEEDSKDII